MHFEFLVEDQSGKKALENIVPKILRTSDTHRIISYKGLGRIPGNMKDSSKARHRILLENLPKLLKGYGKTQQAYGNAYETIVFIVCDLDEKCLKEFREELQGVLQQCNPRPEARFCIAVEEGEAWLLGDTKAIGDAYPDVKMNVLSRYSPDSICGTWELLADAVYMGGSKKLKDQGWRAVGTEKSKWAEKIAPLMNVQKNTSPSFNYFKEKIESFF